MDNILQEPVKSDQMDYHTDREYSPKSRAYHDIDDIDDNIDDLDDHVIVMPPINRTSCQMYNINREYREKCYSPPTKRVQHFDEKQLVQNCDLDKSIDNDNNATMLNRSQSEELINLNKEMEYDALSNSQNGQKNLQNDNESRNHKLETDSESEELSPFEDSYPYHVTVGLPSGIPDYDDPADDGISKLDKISNNLLKACCRGKCWKTIDSIDKIEKPSVFGVGTLILALLSIVFYYYDVVTDILLAEEYFRQKRWYAFGITTGFVFIPLAVVNGINLLWYRRDFIKKKIISRTPVWLLRVAFSFPLMSGLVFRQIEQIYHGWQSRSAVLTKDERRKHYNWMLFEVADAGMLKMFEAFLESAPQLLLQMYIILTETHEEELMMHIIRRAAMIGSWIAMSLSLVSFHKALREAHDKDGRTSLSVPGIIFYYLWRTCEVGPRLIVLALFAAEFHHYMLIAVGFHWLAMSVWVAFQQRNKNKGTTDKIILDIIVGYVLIFSFQNIKEGATRLRQLFYYFVTFTENITMLVSWVFVTESKNEWYHDIVIILVPTAMCLQIVMQCVYYKCFHPKSSRTAEKYGNKLSILAMS